MNMSKPWSLICLALLSNTALVTNASAENEVLTPVSQHHYLFNQSYNLKSPMGSEGVANLWIPLPADTEFQKLGEIEYKGNYNDAYITTDSRYGARTLFVTWADSNQKMTLDVTLDIRTEDWEPLKGTLFEHYQMPKKVQYPEEVQQYLQPTLHVPTDGIVKQTAEKIVGDETNPLKQAQKIYLWVAENMERDNSVVGCGLGDVRTILESGKLSGKCTDINSVFVALARAVGIPAREMFGIRLGRGIKMGKYSSAFGSADENGVAVENGGQHCRAMFYLAGFGWVPVDPADVTKMRLKEHMKNGDPDVKAVSDYLFGSWEMNWVGFNWARDFALVPEPEQGALNNFGYPYGEVDGDPINFYDSKAFAYEYHSIEQ